MCVSGYLHMFYVTYLMYVCAAGLAKITYLKARSFNMLFEYVSRLSRMCETEHGKMCCRLVYRSLAKNEWVVSVFKPGRIPMFKTFVLSSYKSS